MLIGARLRQLATWEPDKIAIVDESGAWTRRAFVSRVARFGSALRGLGLAPGDRVALLSPDRREYLEADYAIMSAGFVRVPLDPRLPRNDLIAMLSFTGASALVTDAVFAETASGLKGDVASLRHVIAFGAMDDALSYEALLASGDDALSPGGAPDDLCSLNLSGGTTGAPKAIMLLQRNLMTVAQTIALGFDVRADSIFLNVRPLWPIAQVILMGYFFAGAQVTLGGRFDAQKLADQIASTRATRTSLVPTQLVRWVDHVVEADPRLARLEAIHVGGSRLPPSVFQRALRTIGPRVGVLYGLTEAPVTCYLPPQRLSGGAGAPDTLIEAVGHELYGYRVRLDGVDTPDPEATGEVLISGANVMAGYWCDEEATQAAFKDGWLRTGDLGRFDGAGDLFIVGRLKEVIRSGATSIAPKEVEDALLQHSAVAEVAVLGLPDIEWGERVAAFVVKAPGADVTEQDLIAHCKERLASYKKPGQVFFVEALPRSHYGKILRPQLLAQAGVAPG